MDGYWDFSATGHVEENESMKQAVIREAKEEIGIDGEMKCKLGGNEYVATQPEKSGIIYYNGYFICEFYNNTPEIKELNKISELKWFTINELPELIIPDRLIALKHYIQNEPYHEIGWEFVNK